MHIKKINGASISAALAEARRLYGDEVMLLDSVPPQGDTPARITIVTDRTEPLPQPTPEPALAMATAPAQAAPMAPPMAPPQQAPGYGYAAPQPRPYREHHTGLQEGISRPQPPAQPVPQARSMAAVEQFLAERFGDDPMPFPAPPAQDPRQAQPAFRPSAPPAAPAAPSRPAPRPADDLSAYASPYADPYATPRRVGRPAGFAEPSPPPAPLQAQLDQLATRFEALERRLADGLLGAGTRWATQPLFGELLNLGFETSTATQLFNQLAQQGHPADGDTDTLRWALAQELRRRLQPTAPRQPTGTQVFVGPGGAGKTSLLLKLALQPGFYGRYRTTVVVIEPEDPQACPYLSPVALYQQHGVPVQAVRTPAEMAQALDRTRGFDQILIDTYPMPMQEAEARKMMLHLRRMVEPVMPMQVQLVLNATRALDSLTPAFLDALPLTPDTLALTHLDEVPRWGRVAEWLLQMQRPTQFVSTSPRLDESVRSFAPTWFVESLLGL